MGYKYKFEDRFVHFRWDDELKEKMVFFSDSVRGLEADVCKGPGKRKMLEEENHDSEYPFVIIDAPWKFIYYDHNYDVKIAYEKGKKIQYKAKDTGRWCDWDDSICRCPFVDGVEYRIKVEEPESRRMTYRELAEWLAKGNGEVILLDTPYVEIKWSYDITQQDKEVLADLRIRRWGTNEWIEPTVDAFNKDCRLLKAVEE